MILWSFSRPPNSAIRSSLSPFSAVLEFSSAVRLAMSSRNLRRFSSKASSMALARSTTADSISDWCLDGSDSERKPMSKIVILDAHVLNPGDLSWDGLKALGEADIFERTPSAEIVWRLKCHDLVLTNKTRITA